MEFFGRVEFDRRGAGREWQDFSFPWLIVQLDDE